jgi:hypothetical protein
VKMKMPNHKSNRAWNIPKISLTVASISLAATLFGLYFIIANYNIQSRADRPFVRAIRADIIGTPDPDAYTLEIDLFNGGKEDAREVNFKMGMIDPTTKETKLLASDTMPRIPALMVGPYQAKLPIHKNDTIKVVMICVFYKDNSSRPLEPKVTFLDFLGWPPSNGRSEFLNPTTAELRLLSSNFSCASL